MPSSKAMGVFMVFWALVTVINTIRALQDPDTREFFAISIVVFASPIAIGTIVAVVMTTLRRREDRLTFKTWD